MEEYRYHYKYPHPNVTTDCVIFGYDGARLKVLLIQRGNEPFKGSWAFPGGFLEMDESAESGALRELREETGLRGAYIQQFHTFSDPYRDPRERVLTVAFFALVRIEEVQGGDDAAKAEWFALDEIPPLAFDHEQMLQLALRALRRQMCYEPIGFELLPNHFTMKQLQTFYEAIFDMRFDNNKFYRKMLRWGILTPVDETETESPRKNPRLYKFNRDDCYQTIREENMLDSCKSEHKREPLKRVKIIRKKYYR